MENIEENSSFEYDSTNDRKERKTGSIVKKKTKNLDDSQDEITVETKEKKVKNYKKSSKDYNPSVTNKVEKEVSEHNSLYENLDATLNSAQIKSRFYFESIHKYSNKNYLAIRDKFEQTFPQNHQKIYEAFVYIFLCLFPLFVGIYLLNILRKISKNNNINQPYTICSIIFIAPIILYLILKLTLENGIHIIIALLSFLIGMVVTLYLTPKLSQNNIRLIVTEIETNKQVSSPCITIKLYFDY
jgi:hypothetical protein